MFKYLLIPIFFSSSLMASSMGLVNRTVVNPVWIKGHITNNPKKKSTVDLPTVQIEMIRRIAKGDRRIELIIDTVGGAYDLKTESFLQFISLIQTDGIIVSCTVQGKAYSMGAAILGYCGERYMTLGSTYMIHSVQVRTRSRINANTIGDLQQLIESINKRLWTNTATHFYNNPKYFLNHFTKETILNADEVIPTCPNVATLILGLKIIES